MNGDLSATAEEYDSFDFDNVQNPDHLNDLGGNIDSTEKYPSDLNYEKDNNPAIMNNYNLDIHSSSPSLSPRDGKDLINNMSSSKISSYAKENANAANFDAFLHDDFHCIEPLETEKINAETAITRQSSAESERCREMRETRDNRIEIRRQEEAELQKQQRELASEELSEFYKKREQQIERRKKENLSQEEKVKEESELNKTKAKSWNRVIEMINEADKFAGNNAEKKGTLKNTSYASAVSRTNLVPKADNPTSFQADTTKMKRLLTQLAESEGS